MYIAQFPERDIGREVAAQFDIPIYETIREALTLGGGTLAVDGVLLIGEHGKYGYNAFGQYMYPRREMFDEIVAVFRETGRSVPVFNDKHLSYDSESAKHMVATSRELGFPLMAGSSLTIAGCMEPWTMPEGAPLEEAMGLFFSGPEIYGYHCIDFLQSLIARRAGGEAGIESVTAYCGESFWQAEAEGLWSRELMEAGLSKAALVEPGYYRDNMCSPTSDHGFDTHWPVAYCFQHRDGFKSTHLMLQGHLKEIVAIAKESNGTIHTETDMVRTNTPETNNYHFAALNAAIEEFVLTGVPPYPIEHYLLTTIALNMGMRGLATPGQRIETPDLNLPYAINSG
jgi:hypothetical protein